MNRNLSILVVAVTLTGLMFPPKSDASPDAPPVATLTFDCNDNGHEDFVDRHGIGGAPVIRPGLGLAESIVRSEGGYPAGYFVSEEDDWAIYHVSPDWQSMAQVVTDLIYPRGMAFIPDEFTGDGPRLLVTGQRLPGGEWNAFWLELDFSLSPCLPEPTAAYDVVYVPLDRGGPFASRVLVLNSYAWSEGSALIAVDAEGNSENVELPEQITAQYPFSMALIPPTFGELGGDLMIVNGGQQYVSGGPVYAASLFIFDLDTKDVRFFADPLFKTGQTGLRQMAFSPTGWGARFEPELANESVLLVSVSGDRFATTPKGEVQVWDARGRMVGSYNGGDDRAAGLDPRGMWFEGSRLFLADGKRDGIIEPPSLAFTVANWDNDVVLDSCEIEDGLASDCDSNGLSDSGGLTWSACSPGNPPSHDIDGDVIPDACDFDTDDDGYWNRYDACPCSPVGFRSLPAGHPVGDSNRDCGIGRKDVKNLGRQLDYGGPDVVHDNAVPTFDYDGDADVDLADAAAFCTAFDGSPF